jgi:RNA-splicing ligase RtcB
MEMLNDRVRSWAPDLEDTARVQVERVSRLPILAGPIALMPDAHWGNGATVGSVIATGSTIIPSAVGVDIGCGMIAVETILTSEQLPDSLHAVRDALNDAIPAGMGKGHGEPSKAWDRWYRTHDTPSKAAAPLIPTAAKQFGTLGGGNHFVEVCLDDLDNVWLVLHSGSRGIGNKLATHHIDVAKSLIEDGTQLEDKELAWLTQSTPQFDAYVTDLAWCQAYAYGNRNAMMDALLRTLVDVLGINVSQIGRGTIEERRINCHHNYTAREMVDGRLLYITRKGAISAHIGDLGVIPGSMGTRSYIVEGLGNPLSYNSCSHGAGRRMSRGAAKRNISLDAFRASMADVGSWQDREADQLLDEAPAAYKPIDEVMAAQADLVTVVAELRQVMNYKGIDHHQRRKHR